MLYEITEQEYLENIQGKHEKPYILVFHAVWCPPCRNFKFSLEELAKNDGVDVYRVDVDANKQLSQEFAVRNLPTWFVFNKNEVVEHVTGYHTYEELANIVKKYL
ncbi:thioredoxin family protein [Mycoplasma zalophidermidis]|uniref:Thioredoxin n=1 Tax=Mycoplasma zalophidermidis TaxID=398174 RepID=A0ABS6DR24_9MOLU|nr:thioredoxin family protein [Mycoplasma zalophidermidis]MBU4689546.1 thioredoxin family protein [Mycoplasma zalophidermidis]MBU4693443.1 thioredoxin family protein [Mycoplasma zalophidermidis]MCR8966279.1 thioredoxin family protein [Mycoplasma zalophidermidis]